MASLSVLSNRRGFAAPALNAMAVGASRNATKKRNAKIRPIGYMLRPRSRGPSLYTLVGLISVLVSVVVFIRGRTSSSCVVFIFWTTSTMFASARRCMRKNERRCGVGPSSMRDAAAAVLTDGMQVCMCDCTRR